VGSTRVGSRRRRSTRVGSLAGRGRRAVNPGRVAPPQSTRVGSRIARKSLFEGRNELGIV